MDAEIEVRNRDSSGSLRVHRVSSSDSSPFGFTSLHGIDGSSNIYRKDLFLAFERRVKDQLSSIFLDAFPKNKNIIAVLDWLTGFDSTSGSHLMWDPCDSALRPIYDRYVRRVRGKDVEKVLPLKEKLEGKVAYMYIHSICN